MTRTLQDLVRDGVLRVAINTGNRASVQCEGDNLLGISPALAQRLAETLTARFEPVVYSGAGRVFADATKGMWDVAFLAIDPERAKKVTFTRPYITIEATFAVHNASKINDIRDVDRSGVRVLTSVGSAYDLHLTKTLKHAALHRSGTPTESFDVFRAGSWDAVAGVRASLLQAYGGDPMFRILPGVLTKVEQAMVLPGYNNPLGAALDAFVAHAIESGFVASNMQG